MLHHYEDLIHLFNQCFLSSHNTRLVKGGDEPVYLPADADRPHHEIHFAHGFFSSALHEIAHWLIAGEKRRLLVDFGYWYEPDGRNAEQQAIFERVEVKPQAMEWILSQASQHRFRISLDNLDAAPAESSKFKDAVFEQVKTYCLSGLAPRAEQFRLALCQFYQSPLSLAVHRFDRAEL